MAGYTMTDGEALRILALIVAHHDAGRPLTGPTLGAALDLSAECGRIRRDKLVERGLVEVVRAGGGDRIIPTAAARALDLPKVTMAKAKRSRPCMRCHASFVSDGPHHRHCNRCRYALSDLSAGGCFAF